MQAAGFSLQDFLNVEVNGLIQLRLYLPQHGLLLDLIAVAGAEIVDVAVLVFPAAPGTTRSWQGAVQAAWSS